MNALIGTSLNRAGRFEHPVVYGPLVNIYTAQMSVHLALNVHGNIYSVHDILSIKHKQMVYVYLAYTIIQMRGMQVGRESPAVAKMYRTIAQSVP